MFPVTAQYGSQWLNVLNFKKGILQNSVRIVKLWTLQREVVNEEHILILSAVHIYGHEVRVLIDTGSHYSLIKKFVAEECKLPIIQTTNQQYGLGDVNVPSIVTVGELESPVVVDGVDLGSVKLLVVPDVAQTLDVTIGWNWLDDPSVIYWKEIRSQANG